MRQAEHKRSTLRSEQGASIVEYALVVALIAIAAVAALVTLGDDTRTEYEVIARSLDTTMPPGDGVSVPGADDERADEGADEPADPGAGGSGGSGSGGSGSGGPSGPGSGSGGSGNGGTGGSGNGGSGGGSAGGAQAGVGEPAGEAIPPAEDVGVQGQTSELYWWDSWGQTGEWKARITFTNDWIRHHYLTLEVTRTLADGSVVTTTVTDFYVPAGGAAPFEVYSNGLTRSGSGVSSDSVVAVSVKVIAVKTSDVDWQTFSHPSSGPTVDVLAPNPPN